MAWIAAEAPSPGGLCAAGRPDGSFPLPVDGMAAMYLLMSLFNLSPWLTLATRRAAASPHPTTDRPTTRTEGE